MLKQNKKFTASLTASGTPRIISVFEETEELARESIIRELSKPGRTYLLEQWKRNGSHIVDITGEYAK